MGRPGRILLTAAVATIASAKLAPAATVHTQASPSSEHAQESPRTSRQEVRATELASRHAVVDLRTKSLLMPLAGVNPASLKGSFYEMRGKEMHQAADIPAPRYTPVRAVSNGTISKLFLSKLGGNTIYEIDPSRKYVFYYAHLERYAPDLKESQLVKRGDVIAYVGTSGNAPPTAPHLHFSIGILGPERRWCASAPIDPYEVFRP